MQHYCGVAVCTDVIWNWVAGGWLAMADKEIEVDLASLYFALPAHPFFEKLQGPAIATQHTIVRRTAINFPFRPLPYPKITANGRDVAGLG